MATMMALGLKDNENNASTNQEYLHNIFRRLHNEGDGKVLTDVLRKMLRENTSLTDQIELEAFIERDNLSVIIPVTIIYSIIFVTGIVGNVCTCLVIIRNKYMRTVTNYYLFNLSVSDLLLLFLGLPQEIYTTWFPAPYIFGETFCRVRFLASELSSNVSVITITAFTVERYVAICHPIKVPTHAGLPRAIKVMVAVWLVSLMCAIPVAIQFGIIYGDYQGKRTPTQCTTLDPEKAKIIFQVSTFIFFVFPMSVISLLYVFIAMAIRRSTLNRSGSNASTCSTPKTALNANRKLNVTARLSTTTPQTKARQSVLKMLVAVVVAFFLCFAPFHVQRLMIVYYTQAPPLLDYIIFYLSGTTFYVSATINPILYSIMSLKFRQAFRSTLLRCYTCMVVTRRPQPRRRAHRNSYTFKFQHRSQISVALHCGGAESSTSTANNSNNSNNNNNGSNANNSNSPVLCCGDGVSSSLSRPLVEMISRDGQRERPFHEVNGSSRNNISERML